MATRSPQIISIRLSCNVLYSDYSMIQSSTILHTHKVIPGCIDSLYTYPDWGSKVSNEQSQNKVRKLSPNIDLGAPNNIFCS